MTGVTQPASYSVEDYFGKDPVQVVLWMRDRLYGSTARSDVASRAEG